MICTPRRISRNRCLFPEHVNAGRVFSRADHETELAPPLISIKVGKSQEGGEQASDPSECLQLKVQGKETDINPLLLAVFRQRFKSGYGSHYFHVNLTIALILPC